MGGKKGRGGKKNKRGWGWGVVDRRTVLVWGERERKERKREERERKRRREERGRKGVHPSGLSSLPSISNQGGRGGLGALGALFECFVNCSKELLIFSSPPNAIWPYS